MMNKDVILIGFMGSGKTTTGKKLAELLGFEFLDTDERLEEQEGMTIRRIFEEKGEEYFRQAETGLLETLLKEDGKRVISTGGGMPLRPENAVLLKKLGTVVYLRVSGPEVYERLKDTQDRPLLSGEDPKGTIEKLLTQREPLYLSCAEISVDTNGRSPDQIVQEILGAVKEEHD